MRETGSAEWRPGDAFELAVLRLFELEGVDVIWPYTVEMAGHVVEQIDGAVYVQELSLLIESKDYERPINVEPLAKLRNQLLRRPSGVLGVVFSENGFTDPARTLAQFSFPQVILLWEGEELRLAALAGRMVEGLRAKFRYAVEQGLADLNLQDVFREPTGEVT